MVAEVLPQQSADVGLGVVEGDIAALEVDVGGPPAGGDARKDARSPLSSQSDLSPALKMRLSARSRHSSSRRLGIPLPAGQRPSLRAVAWMACSTARPSG